MSLAFASAPLSVEQARTESIGFQALAYVGKRLPLQLLCSAAGHYIGTADADGPVLSSGQRMFLSAMVSFYNSREGGAMLKRCGFEGLSDLGGLDLERRKVIADLTLHYNGW